MQRRELVWRGTFRCAGLSVAMILLTLSLGAISATGAKPCRVDGVYQDSRGDPILLSQVGHGSVADTQPVHPLTCVSMGPAGG